jgi:conjugative transfer signal peptidase TraF
MNKNGKILAYTCLVVLILGTGFITKSILKKNILVNISPSVPVGIYLRTSSKKTPAYGDLIRFCAPRWISERGYTKTSRYCLNKRPALLKPIAALPGDKIGYTTKSGLIYLTLNNRMTSAVVLKSDTKGRAMPMFRPGIVPQNSFLPLSTYNARSADGRYFGPVSDEKIIGWYKCFMCYTKKDLENGKN